MGYIETQAEEEAYYKAYKKKEREILEDPILKYFKQLSFEVMKVARPIYILCGGEATKMVFDTNSQDLLDKIAFDQDEYIRTKYNTHNKESNLISV